MSSDGMAIHRLTCHQMVWLFIGLLVIRWYGYSKAYMSSDGMAIHRLTACHQMEWLFASLLAISSYGMCNHRLTVLYLSSDGISIN